MVIKHAVLSHLENSNDLKLGIFSDGEEAIGFMNKSNGLGYLIFSDDRSNSEIANDFSTSVLDKDTAYSLLINEGLNPCCIASYKDSLREKVVKPFLDYFGNRINY